MPKRNTKGEILFNGYPEFKPNRTPREMFQSGIMGGTYWRPIHSKITKKDHTNAHKKFPASWWRGIPDNWLTLDYKKYDKTINKYGVKVGTTLQYWESKHWITHFDPYGWIQWYCNFYHGRRCPDDDRQIKRWIGVAGDTGRFRLNLINRIHKLGKKWDDFSVSPKIRQTLLHWGYELTKKDYDEHVRD